MRSRRSVLRSALVVMVLSAGCGRADGFESARFHTETLPSGMVRVTNDGLGQWDAASQWTLVEDLRLGSVEQAGPELFGRVGSILPHPDGRIYVLDSQAQEIRTFSASGEFLGTLGGRGDGPGELATAAGLSLSPNGELWVWGGSGRYTVFDLSGREGARYTRGLRGIITPWSGGFTADGRFLDWAGDRETIGVNEAGQPMTNGRTTYLPVAFTPPDRLDTLPSLEYWHPVTAEGQLMGGPGGGAVRSLALHLNSKGIWFSPPDEYAVHLRSLEGDTTLVFTVPSRPMTYPDAMIDSVIGALAERGTIRTRDSYVTRARLVMRVLSDDAGHIYVFPQEDDVPVGSVVDVFVDSGIFLGRMHFPNPIMTDAPPPRITRDAIYAVVQNELGVPFVVRHRIVRP